MPEARALEPDRPMPTRGTLPEQLPLPVMEPEREPAPSFVSVVIPVYNEEQALGGVLAGVRGAMDSSGFPYEIVVVDDCSTDRSLAIARQSAVRVLHHAEQRGSGAARKTGIRAAKGDVVVMIDADGTYPATAIPEMLRHFPDYDQVIGWRQKERGSHPALRSLAKLLIRRLACYLTRKEIPDLNSGLKAFKREPMLRFMHLIPDGFSCVTTMTLAFLINGYAIKYHPIDYFPRIGTSKFHPVKDTRAYLLTVIKMVMYFNPLRVFLPLAAFMLAVGLVKTSYDAFTSDMQQTVPALREILWISLPPNIVIFVSAVMVLLMGLLADLIVQQGKR